MMAPVNHEPECWNCRHFLTENGRRLCTLHGVRLPVEKGPHLVCSRWCHRQGGRVLWWRWRDLTCEGMLYRYLPFGVEAPRPLAPFDALPRLRDGTP